MTDKELCKKLGVGFEWLDQNYDSLDETAKAAFDEFSQGVVVLVNKYGIAKGFIIGNAIVDVVGIVAVSGVVSIAANIALDKWKSWRENRLNKTGTTDSE